MKKILTLSALIIFCAASICYGTYGSLKSLVRQDRPIKVFVGSFTNDSGNDLLITEEFKKSVEEALRNRRSVSFTLENSPNGSDIEVSGIIKKYQYMEKGPLKPSFGVSTMALDAMATMSSNYAEMEVTFIITNPVTHEKLWQGDVYHYVKQTMTHKESIPILFDHISRRFLWKSFGKG